MKRSFFLGVSIDGYFFFGKVNFLYRKDTFVSFLERFLYLLVFSGRSLKIIRR